MNVNTCDSVRKTYDNERSSNGYQSLRPREREDVRTRRVAVAFMVPGRTPIGCAAETNADECLFLSM